VEDLPELAEVAEAVMEAQRVSVPTAEQTRAVAEAEAAITLMVAQAELAL
jgi:hypothetical protein